MKKLLLISMLVGAMEDEETVINFHACRSHAVGNDGSG